MIDPRATETSMAATQHLALYPKSDFTLLYGVARLLIERDWIDRDFIARPHQRLRKLCRIRGTLFPVARRAKKLACRRRPSSNSRDTIHEGQASFVLVDHGRQSKPSRRAHRSGDHQFGADDRQYRPPGTGANSITGQCNAMGSRLFSNTTNLLGGHDFANAAHRRKVADVLGIDESNIPAQDELALPPHSGRRARGEIRGLWVVCTNPAHSWINQRQARDILDRGSIS